MSLFVLCFPLLKLLEQIRTLEQTVYRQSGEKDELFVELNKIKEHHTSDILHTESMASKIQVREQHTPVSFRLMYL